MAKPITAFAAIAAGGLLLLTACSSNSATSESSTAPAAESSAATVVESSAAPAVDAAYKIGLLLPETAVARYESKDKPYFEAKLKELCPSCELLYANANSDVAAQQQQANSMLTQGVNVLVVDPLDGKAAASIVAAATEKGVPVVAYDRLISSPDLAFVISNDYEEVGKLQGQALVDKLTADGVPEGAGIIMMNGAVTDNNAGNIKKGALSVIEGSGYKILASTDTWDPAEAQKWVSGQITKYGQDIKGVYSANDGNAGGAIAAFKAAGLPVPPMTGLDASLAGLQSVLVGDMYMTTYNAFKSEAEAAATAAFDLASGKTPDSTSTVDGHPASLNPPTAVTADTIQSTVIADGFYTAAEICTPDFADACAKYGIK
jgi:D-xylose transport system substrate-binding protein